MSDKKQVNSTFIISIIVTLLVVIWGMVSPKTFETVANSMFGFLVDKFGWFYTITMMSFVGFAVWIGFFSKYKDIRLGPQDSKPEYSFLTWFAMLFSAGMGIGLVFWGAAEPMNYFVAPLGAEPGTPEAARFAMQKSFLHWGFHPWANYAILALALALMQFRYNKPGLVSSVFIPLIGEERVNGPIGKIIDIFSIFATVAGIATSLGLGTYQINSGLKFLFNVPETVSVQLSIVIIITIIYIVSTVTGLDNGIKHLSNINVYIFTFVIIACFLIGPSIKILDTMIESTGYYLQTFIGSSLEAGAFFNKKWYGSWTIFYFAWFIAWAPFVGTFIARISKGRTIKEFIIGVLIAPSLASFIWFVIAGTMGMEQGLEFAKEAIKSTPTTLFSVLSNYTFGNIISMICVCLLVTFFVTSANSSTFVLAMFSSNGDLNPTGPKKILWGILQSGLTLALMIGTTNGLQMLQTASIAVAFPFAFIMIFAMVSIVKILKKDSI
ncbi:BCCT family transporter [Brachyspira pilosicoli]|uniref:BCCT family transporter n=1 Tax=Brachyspira pilosicoli TaxID=52584 RepID=UPI0030068763